ncbi:MAG: prepilin-type N-terminal cleavage/methylation domain-containing protein [Smithella sp.]|jgi:type IV pilus assembly protein PilW|nr:prepilin-type N-terminal cleavage/methylation domain-containing protein [Smithellaceae bacterium]NLA41029.1 prepilin-type N-terminal cleavage/methylation domain-containing protein [Smithella sp.]
MKADSKGFTMIELLIAMVVGLVVLAATYSVFALQNKTLATQEKLASSYQNARIAMDMMIRDINMAGYNFTGTGSTLSRCTGALPKAGTVCAGISAANASSITITMDVTDDAGTGSSDGDCDDANENITYDLYTSSGGIKALGRKSSTSASKQPAVEYVESLNFVYEKEDGDTPTDLSEIRRVKITIITIAPTENPAYTDPTYGDHYRRFTLTGYATPRNLKY